MTTNETTYTPGPWRTGRGAADAIYAGSAGDGHRIGCFYTENAYEDRFPDEPNRDVANARLASQAPEMLKALALAYELCQAQSDPEHCLHGKRVNWEALSQRFGRIIVEATSEWEAHQ